MARIIFATSGSGKSHWARGAYGASGIPVVDGDGIISATCGWPKAKQWWKLPEADVWQALHARVLGQVLKRNTDLTVVWWAKLPIVVPGLKLVVPDLEIFGLQIPVADLRRNWRSREDAITRGESGHSSRSWESYLDGWVRAQDELNSQGIKTFSSWDEVATALKIYRSKTANL